MARRRRSLSLDERIAALITNPDELTEVMIDAGESEDSITDKIAKVLRFIELQAQVEVPQSNPSSQSNTISQPSAANTEPPQLLCLPLVLSAHMYRYWRLVQILHLKMQHLLLATILFLLLVV